MTNHNFWKNHNNKQLSEWQKDIEDKSNSPTFCVLPWIHMATRPNGDMRLCCGANASGAGVDPTIGIVKDSTGQHANFGNQTPMEAWNSQYMKDVRKNMLAGKISASCQKCFQEEARGISSKRIWEHNYWQDENINIQDLINETLEDGTAPERIHYLDLRLGHTCNLKCIMCSPHDSSQWVGDYYKLKKLTTDKNIQSQLHWVRKEFNNQWHENPEFWEEMYKQIPNIKQVYFAGGEPLMIREHKEFIKEIIKQGYEKNIVLRYNTNGLLIDEEFIKLWSPFKRVQVGFSLDGNFQRNHFIRYPSDWEIVDNNLDLLDNTSDNIDVTIATCLSILNIKHLPDFVKWKINKKYKKINTRKNKEGLIIGGGLVNIHLVYMPTFLDMRILPKEHKEDVTKRFEELKTWLWENYTQDDAFWKLNPYGWRRYEGVLDFMNSEDKTAMLPSFKDYINKMDIIRETNFKEVFPELADLV